MSQPRKGRRRGHLLSCCTHRTAYGKRVTALGSSCGQNFTAILGRHSLSETMLVSSFSIPWLKGSFHRL